MRVPFYPYRLPRHRHTVKPCRNGWTDRDAVWAERNRILEGTVGGTTEWIRWNDLGGAATAATWFLKCLLLHPPRHHSDWPRLKFAPSADCKRVLKMQKLIWAEMNWTNWLQQARQRSASWVFFRWPNAISNATNDSGWLGCNWRRVLRASSILNTSASTPPAISLYDGHVCQQFCELRGRMAAIAAGKYSQYISTRQSKHLICTNTAAPIPSTSHRIFTHLHPPFSTSDSPLLL